MKATSTKTVFAIAALVAALAAPTAQTPAPQAERRPAPGASLVYREAASGPPAAAPIQPPDAGNVPIVNVPMKLCVADEFTHGLSERHFHRRDAEAAAAADWRRVVLSSLGERYTNFGIAGDPLLRCWRDEGGVWGCTAQGRPCALAPAEPTPTPGTSSEAEGPAPALSPAPSNDRSVRVPRQATARNVR